MIQVDSPFAGESRPQPARRRLLTAILAVLLIALALGYLGWILPSIGGSLVIPAAIVLGIGAAIIVASLVIAARRGPRRWLQVFAVGVAVVTVLAAIWTIEFSLPASIWLSDATAQAHAALAHLQQSPLNHHGIVRPQPCSVHTRGSVGPLDAPYRECLIYTPEGHFVTFTGLGTSTGGLSYTDRGAETFLDQCSRHLTGDWWMFTRADLSANDPGGCPFGYHFHGGP